METQIIDGRGIRDKILEKIKEEVSGLSFRPKFCDVVVGSDPASLQYVRMKNKTAEMLGIEAVPAMLREDATTDEVVAKIEELNKIEGMAGIIVQLPLPSHIDKERVLSAISLELDVDCINPKNSADFYAGGDTFIFPTARAVFAVLFEAGVEIPGKKFAIVGRGELVGRPVLYLLTKNGALVDVIDRSTENVDEIIKSAEVIISASGKRGIVTSENISEGVVIVDAGASDADGSVVGDIDLESVIGISSAISPVPGGVGPVTVAMLFDNVLLSAKKKMENKSQ